MKSLRDLLKPKHRKETLELAEREAKRRAAKAADIQKMYGQGLQAMNSSQQMAMNQGMQGIGPTQQAALNQLAQQNAMQSWASSTSTLTGRAFAGPRSIGTIRSMGGFGTLVLSEGERVSLAIYGMTMVLDFKANEQASDVEMRITSISQGGEQHKIVFHGKMKSENPVGDIAERMALIGILEEILADVPEDSPKAQRAQEILAHVKQKE